MRRETPLGKHNRLKLYPNQSRLTFSRSKSYASNQLVISYNLHRQTPFPSRGFYQYLKINYLQSGNHRHLYGIASDIGYHRFFSLSLDYSLTLSLSLSHSLSLAASLSLYLFIYLSISGSHCLCLYLSVCVSLSVVNLSM